MRCSALTGGGVVRLVAGIAALGLSLVLGGTALAAPQYDLDCTSCHNMPPKDATTPEKDPDDGSVPGNHEKHAGSTKESCVVCHGAQVTGYATGHRNTNIELLDSLQYGRKVNGFLNQTSVPPNPLSSCATALCHSNGKGAMTPTPNWGSAALTVPGGCSVCHGAAPDGGNHPSLSGPGAKHGAYFGTGTDSCGNCHSDHRSEGRPFGHATSAGKRSIDVHFARGGGFDGTKCTNVYCHSNGKGSFADPTWGLTLDCSGCHGTATSNTLSGKHASHVDNASVLGSNYGCVDCHADTVTSNSSIKDVTKHVNGGVDFGAIRVGTPSSGNCNNTYCHSDGKGNSKSVSWSQSQSIGCKDCHGSATNAEFVSIAGEPNYQNGGADNTFANSHKNHVKAAGDCANCHYDTTDNGTTLKAGGKHTDGSIEVVAGPGKSFTINNKTCSNVSCHSGNGLIANVNDAKWGASLGCIGCHGDAATLSTNAHQKHANAKGYGCVTCHADTVVNNSTLAVGGPHGNGVVNVVGSSVTFTSADKTCATACHGTAHPAWNDNTTGACGTCHKALSNTVNGVITKDAHGTHFGANGVNYGPKFDGSNVSSCAVCHSYTSDVAASHDDGIINLNNGFAKNGTCTGCHSQSVDWTSTARLSCDSCHVKSLANNNTLAVINGITAPEKAAAGSTGHGRSGIDQSCTACHDNTSAHIGVAGGTKRLASALSGGNNNECLGCHSDSLKVSNPDKQITAVHYGFANNCAVCHDPHGTGNSNMILSNISSAGVRINGVTFSGTTNFITADGKGICQVCHTQTTYFRKDVAVDSNSHQQVGANCLDCHKHNPGPGKTAFEPNGACNACHGYPPVPRNPSVAFGTHGQYSSARFEDYSGGGGAHVSLAHLDPNVTPDMGFEPCLKCHNGADATHVKALPIKSHIENVTVVVDPQYRFSKKNSFMGYSGAHLNSGANNTGSCFNVSCHFKRSPQWSREK